MSHARRELGSRGEELAAAFFIARGYKILDRNWRCELGELDLVVGKGEEIRIIEVKTRKSLGGGLPEESITESKLETLADLADRYREEHGRWDQAVHLDVLAIMLMDVPEYTYLPDIDAP